MIDITIEGREVSIPTRWDDLTWGQVKNLPKEAGPLGVHWLEYFTGEKDTLNRLSVAHFTQFSSALTFLAKEPEISIDDYSRAITFEGNDYFLPGSITGMKAGPYFDLFNIIKEHGETIAENYEHLEKIVKLLVEYAIFEKSYDYTRAMQRDIDSLNFVQVQKAIAFFFKDSISLNSGTEENAPIQSGQAKRSRPGIMKFLRNTVLS